MREASKAEKMASKLEKKAKKLHKKKAKKALTKEVNEAVAAKESFNVIEEENTSLFVRERAETVS